MSERDGVILLDKPPGITSHGAVDRVRRILGIRRVGHTGTLDPQATGLLMICVGRATKIARFIREEPKVYRADCHLGIVTRTLDLTGEVVERRSVEADDDVIRRAFDEAQGSYDQLPPMVSALKHQGKPLYAYARAGEEVERKPRRVDILDIRVNAIDREGTGVRVDFTVSCSRGTYIRSLCDDIGERLGSGGAMGELRRLGAGRFSVRDAVTLESLEEMTAAGSPPLMGMAEALADLAAVTVVPAAVRAVRNGQGLKPPMIMGKMELPPPGAFVSVLDPSGELLAVHEAAAGATTVTRTVRVV